MPPLYSMKRCIAVASLCMLMSGCYWGIPPADDGWSTEAPELHGMDSTREFWAAIEPVLPK
ncbi:MAG: hypothetical protein JW807_15350 [Spirochaetes bacterium]|nr:hypothetical protein [Spirochaetota bacterium]